MHMLVWAKRIGPADAVLLLANILGCAIYLLRARYAWIIPEEAANGIHTITGEPFVWAAAVLPVWIVFLVINLIWGVKILVRRQSAQGRIWLASAFVWMVAVLFDFAHH
jgi:hypothetical protein